MAKEQGTNKSAFIRSALQIDPDLNLKRINELWSKSGSEGEITAVLFYQVRRKMGLKRAEYRWVLDKEQP